MTWVDPGKTDPTDETTLAYRLYEQLAPFQSLDTNGHLWALCDGIYAMFQEVEELITERADGLPGYANMLDINAVRSDFLAWLAQFVGATLKPGLDDQAQRDYIASLPGFNRCRPATIIATVANTLTGSQFVELRERHWLDSNGNWVQDAWRYTVITKPSETPNVALTQAAIQDQKPGPDVAFHWMIEAVDYAWVDATYATYADIEAAFPTYADLLNAQLP